MVRFIRRAAIVLGALTMLLVLFLALTPQGRTVVRTTALVVQVMPALPVKPQEWFTDEPLREEVLYPLAQGEGLADIYRLPRGPKRAAILFFLGVNPAGRDDERVINLGKALARAGFVVMVPWSENMVNKRVDPGDIDNLVRAFQYLSSREGVDAQRVGMAGFCIGSSMVMVAAQDPRIRDDVEFVNFFSGYYDARDFLKQFASGRSFYRGVEEPWEPDKLTIEVFTRHLIESLEDQGERELLTRLFLDGDTSAEVEVAQLTPSGQAVYRLLSGVSLEEADRLITQLPQKVQEGLDVLSPSTNVDALKARVFIMHDREDDLAPVEESRRLADALATRGDFRYTEFSFFQHVDPTATVGPLTFVTEAFKLYRHLYGIIALAG